MRHGVGSMIGVYCAVTMFTVQFIEQSRHLRVCTMGISIEPTNLVCVDSIVSMIARQKFRNSRPITLSRHALSMSQCSLFSLVACTILHLFRRLVRQIRKFRKICL